MEIDILYYISVFGLIVFSIFDIKPKTTIGWSILTASLILAKAIA